MPPTVPLGVRLSDGCLIGVGSPHASLPCLRYSLQAGEQAVLLLLTPQQGDGGASGNTSFSLPVGWFSTTLTFGASLLDLLADGHLTVKRSPADRLVLKRVFKRSSENRCRTVEKFLWARSSSRPFAEALSTFGRVSGKNTKHSLTDQSLQFVCEVLCSLEDKGVVATHSYSPTAGAVCVRLTSEGRAMMACMQALVDRTKLPNMLELAVVKLATALYRVHGDIFCCTPHRPARASNTSPRPAAAPATPTSSSSCPELAGCIAASAPPAAAVAAEGGPCALVDFLHQHPALMTHFALTPLTVCQVNPYREFSAHFLQNALTLLECWEDQSRASVMAAGKTQLQDCVLHTLCSFFG